MMKNVFVNNNKHFCELRKGMESELPKLPPNAGSKKIVRQFLSKLMIASPVHPVSQLIFRSMESLAHERRRQIKMGVCFLIHPYSIFWLVWEITMFVVFYTSLITLPYEISFGLRKGYNLIRILQIVLDLTLLFDIILKFFVGYKPKASNEIQLNRNEIIMHYLKSGFFVDLLILLPLHVILVNLPDNTNFGLAVFLLLLCSIKILLRLGHALNYFQRSIQLIVLNRGTHSTMRLLQLLALTVILVHWTACMLYAWPRYLWYINPGTRSESWLARAGIDPSTKTTPIGDRYLKSMFMGVSLLYGAGYGLVSPKTPVELILATSIIIIGKLFNMYIFVVFLHVMLDMNSSEAKYCEQMFQMNEFMRSHQLPRRMQRRLIKYYDYHYQKSFYNEMAIVNTLSDNLHKEILLHRCRHLVETVAIFHHLPKRLIGAIVGYLKPKVFLVNDVLFKAGMHGDCMYFLSSGTLVVLSPIGKKVCELEDGAHFGEICILMESSVRIASVVARETCEVFQLNRCDFHRVILPYPKLLQRIETIAAKRLLITAKVDGLNTKDIITRYTSPGYQLRRKSLAMYDSDSNSSFTE